MTRAETNPVHLKPSLVIREEFDHYAILFDPDTGRGYAVNPVSVLICRALEAGRTVAETAAEIRSRFADTPDTVVQDVQTFVDSLVRRGLARTDEPRGRPRRKSR